MEIFNNPWTIGIGGGVLSGLIVTFISRFLLSRRDQREYIQKVLGANREVVYAVRPGISEGLVPTAEVLDGISEATARKFGVDRKDLHRPYEIAQELMKEVMDSSFISAKTKEEYCSRLVVLTIQTTTTPPTEASSAAREGDIRRSVGFQEYRSRMVAMMSMMMGVLAAIMTVVLALWEEGPLLKLAINLEDTYTAILLPGLATVFAAALALYAMLFVRGLRDRLERRAREKKVKQEPPQENPPSEKTTLEKERD